MLIYIITILLSFTINCNVAITTRGSRFLWRDDRPEFSRYYYERDQYRDFGRGTFHNRGPPPLSIEDIYREAERYNQNYNPRFHRQNRWSFDGRDRLSEDSGTFSGTKSNIYQYDNEAHQNTQYTGSHDKGINQPLYTPAPHLPWEDALRHSVYLTLIRDKIDNIISSNRKANVQNLEQNRNGKDIYESTDVDLWRNIKKAPFKTNGKEKGPVFGDIAILSRGKLIESPEGFEFVEDENFKECIECHLYSARPNEDEAEKILMANCNHPSCKNQIVRALWTVRRIRHRNTESDEPKFMYELMFSIASPKSNHKGLDYNVPSQTFTINENDKTIKNTFEEKKKIIFSDEKLQDSFTRNPKRLNNINANNQFELNTGEYKTLNIGEYTSTESNTQSVSNPRIMNLYDGNSGHEQSYNKQIPVITHLHHHYYLNDKGIPMLKPSIKYDKHGNYETPALDIRNIDTITEMDPRTSISSIADITDSDVHEILNTNIHSTAATRKTNKPPLTYNQSKKKNHEPGTKQFIPSPKDERNTYSELDPLYTVPTDSSMKIKQTQTITEEVHSTANPKTNKFKYQDDDDYSLKDVVEKTTQRPIFEFEDSVTNPDVGTTIENFYISENPIQDIKQRHDENDHKSTETAVHLVYPETIKHTTPPIDVARNKTANKRIERKPYKVTRRVKQKKFSDLVKAQSPKPNTSAQPTKSVLENEDIKTKETEEIQKKISDISRKFATNKTNTFDPQRVSRQKYQRKYNSWNSRRSRPNPSSTTTTTTSTEEVTTVNVTEAESHITEELNTENPADTTYSESIPDNIEGESEKEISIDRISTLSDDEVNESGLDSIHTSNNNTDNSNETTEPNITTVTETHKDQSEHSTSYFAEEDANSSNQTENNTTEMTTLSSEIINEDLMYTPLTKKSYVTSISLKLGNKTRPYYHTATESTDNDISNTVEETQAIHNVTSTPEYFSDSSTTYSTKKKDLTESPTTRVINLFKDTTPQSDDTIGTTEEGVIVAKIVQHSSLHKLKIEDIE